MTDMNPDAGLRRGTVLIDRNVHSGAHPYVIAGFVVPNEAAALQLAELPRREDVSPVSRSK